MDKVFIIIPTLDPDIELMTKFIKELQKDFTNILVINDGSKSSYDNFFQELEKKHVIVLKHYVNLGKGRGIKNAFNYILNNYPDVLGCVTCDCDGQHSYKDVKKIAKEVLKSKDKLVLGVRDFDKDNVPLRSQFGNKITRNIFKVFIGLDITDTQTGLRGFSRNLMTLMMDLAGERYEYETNMLIFTKEEGIKIKEVPIETIYLNSNVNSHFNPLKDSILIYKLFLKYFVASFSSFILDIILFLSIFNILEINQKILAATILSRIVSSLYNYIINSNLVFKNMSIPTLIKYYMLVFIVMFISGCFVTYLYNLLKIPVLIIKIIVDTILWVINLIIQREFVFKGAYNGNYEE